jgi:hypothetical protein
MRGGNVDKRNVGPFVGSGKGFADDGGELGAGEVAVGAKSAIGKPLITARSTKPSMNILAQ